VYHVYFDDRSIVSLVSAFEFSTGQSAALSNDSALRIVLFFRRRYELHLEIEPVPRFQALVWPMPFFVRSPGWFAPQIASRIVLQPVYGRRCVCRQSSLMIDMIRVRRSSVLLTTIDWILVPADYALFCWVGSRLPPGSKARPPWDWL